MANHVTLGIAFTFDYDGVTSTIVVNTKTGPIVYDSVLGPQFNATAVGAEEVTVANDDGSPISTTATMAGGGVLTVDIPSGLIAGGCICAATLIY